MITLTNGVQVPENAVQLQTTAAIDGYYVTQPLRLVQYDETLPVAAVQLTYQSQPYIPPTGAELNVRMGKPDGTTVYNPCLGMDSSGIVYFAFTQQMTIVAGTGTLTVEITDSGVKNSAPIIAEIRPNPVPKGSIESADEFLTLQEILAEAEKWGQIVQTNASNIQQVVDNLEDIQNAAENAQAAAASAAAAQQAAQEALGFRKFYSAVVPDANGNLDPSRPMTVGPAVSVEIESAGDRIQSVTALGFTQQAGSGDPSPTNVRQLTNGGLKLTKYELTGNESYTKYSNGIAFSRVFSGTLNNPKAYCTDFYQISTGNKQQGAFWFGYGDTNVYCFINPEGTATTDKQVRAFKAEVQARYAAGNPITFWYAPADESQATGIYAPIQIQSSEYRATCLELTAPLCDGDSVVSWVKSGCDKVVTLDGGTSDGFVYADEGASGNLRRMRVTIPGVLDYNKGGFGFSDWVNYKVGYANTEESFYCTVDGVLLFLAAESLAAAKQILSQRPLTMWLRSANYTPAADIQVSLETHVQGAFELDGTESGSLSGSNGAILVNARTKMSGKAKGGANSGLCSVAKMQYLAAGSGFYFDPNNTNLWFGKLYAADFGMYTEFQAKLAELYTAGTPAQFVYPLATPITYAHPAVILEAATGEQLTYTVTGQRGGTVSVTLKPFQDGGNAKQLDGLTLAALQNLIAPIGYTFEWAPVEGGPDLSTPAKVAEYFGFGTWQAYGTGQVLVGVDSGQTEFATAGKTGGEKAHTLTTSEVPPQNVSAELDSTPRSVMVDAGIDNTDYGCTFNIDKGYKAKPATTIQTEGGGQAHNNLQPYITVYRWQRVA